jgi:hypothetical protein
MSDLGFAAESLKVKAVTGSHFIDLCMFLKRPFYILKKEKEKKYGEFYRSSGTVSMRCLLRMS